MAPPKHDGRPCFESLAAGDDAELASSAPLLLSPPPQGATETGNMLFSGDEHALGPQVAPNGAASAFPAGCFYECSRADEKGRVMECAPAANPSPRTTLSAGSALLSRRLRTNVAAARRSDP